MGIRGFGRTLAEAIEQAAFGLTAIITDPKLIQPTQSITIMRS